ncbi:hypothetical protein JCM9152_4590 [Halalkalibacter hemicellulosilyticusJCM 9152]|uniref:Uncharacterized protein n=1 Tax=Halalkalibacter hemicellulosilyticusJCM 9152 TaxID=1236971 RepID=W4QLK3_9BACI|nr:hypothetical protein JCM9152_4590 [Halalkalibacter hemicellulosilyticusJCM 9152]
MSFFQGDIEKAISKADYQWLMFYPCLYFFAMWDAFKDAGGEKDCFSFLPFAFLLISLQLDVFILQILNYLVYY